MAAQTSLGFDKYDGTEFFNIIHQNTNMDKVNDVIEDQILRINENEDNIEFLDLRLTAHQDASMPHKLYNAQDGKYYKYGEQISSEGKPQLIFEEVI